MRSVAAMVLASCALGCATTAPHLSLAAKLRIDEETTLLDVPEGRARPVDATVRVIAHDRLCSGVLVDRALALTAQHCVEDAAPGDLRIELGGDALPWGRAGVTGVVRCPCWRSQAGRDVAILVLERPLPLDVPVWVPRIGTPPRAGERVRVVGFGTGREVWDLPGSDGWVLQSRRSARDGRTTLLLDDSFYVDASAEHGDSGGAVVSLDDGDLLGILSEKRETAPDVGADDPRAERDVDAERATLAARLEPCAQAVEYARELANGDPAPPPLTAECAR